MGESRFEYNQIGRKNERILNFYKIWSKRVGGSLFRHKSFQSADAVLLLASMRTRRCFTKIYEKAFIFEFLIIFFSYPLVSDILLSYPFGVEAWIIYMWDGHQPIEWELFINPFMHPFSFAWHLITNSIQISYSQFRKSLLQIHFQDKQFNAKLAGYILKLRCD